MTRIFFTILTISTSFFIFFLPVRADINAVAVTIGKDEVSKGELVRFSFLPFELHIHPGALPEGAAVLINETTDTAPWPEKMRLTTKLFKIRILDENGKLTKPDKPLYIKYSLNVFKDIRSIPYQYSVNTGWVQVKEFKFDAEKGIYFYSIEESSINFAFLEPQGQDGFASWYKYKECDCAASNVYPRGTLLRVWRVLADELKDSIDVIINDFGPEQKLHPDRVIDLDITAFKKIAKKSEGVISVKTKLLKRKDGI